MNMRSCALDIGKTSFPEAGAALGERGVARPLRRAGRGGRDGFM